MSMDKKKVILYTVIIMAALTASLLFSLVVDRMLGRVTYRQSDSSDVSGQMIMKDVSVAESGAVGAEGKAVSQKPDTGESGSRNTGTEKDASNSDIRLSEESIAEFYKNRNRGEDLNDRYDSLAVDALFGDDCGELEPDRVALVRQLKGYLENTVKDGKNVRSVSVYREGNEYFVRADIAGGQKDFHIIRYEGGYDFESVFIPSDEQGGVE